MVPVCHGVTWAPKNQVRRLLFFVPIRYFSTLFAPLLGSAVTFGSINDASSQISTSPASASVVQSSTASVSKKPTLLSVKSAWLRGPPTVPSPRSQSPPLPSATPTYQTHSRRSSALGQAVPIQDGVSLPWSNADALRSDQALVVHSMRPPQHGGSNGTPHSPSYSSRPMQNGAGPRSQGVQGGGPPVGLGSPRIGPHPQSSGLPPPTPQLQTHMQPPMQMGW
jgi:hypothetical protein